MMYPRISISIILTWSLKKERVMQMTRGLKIKMKKPKEAINYVRVTPKASSSHKAK